MQFKCGTEVASTLPRPKVWWNGFIGSFLVAPDNGFVAPLPIRVARRRTKEKEQPLPLRFHAARLMTRITNYQTMTVAPKEIERATNILRENGPAIIWVAWLAPGGSFERVMQHLCHK